MNHPDRPDYQALKATNARLNLAESRSGALTLDSLPRYVMVELTQGCNLRCPMCRSRSIGYRERELDRTVLSSVAEMLFPTAEMVDIRGWGESLLAPDINDIIRLVAAYHARCRVVTNLSVNRLDTLNLLVETGSMIDVSLDSADQEVLDHCRTGARLALITRNLRHLVKDLQQKRGDVDSLRIIATLQAMTLDGLTDLVRYAADVGVKEVVLNEVTLADDDPNALVGRERQVDEAVREATAAADATGVRVFAGTALGHCTGVQKNIPFCIHPWAYATIGYDGSVGYCDHLIGPMMPFSCMGDINRSSFEAIWNGAAWERLRQWHAAPPRRDVSTYHACYRCYQHRNVDFEDMFEPRLERLRLNLIPSP